MNQSLPNLALKKFGGLNMEKEELYPEEEMMIEQEAYKSFLDVAEYGKIGIEHFKKVFDELAKRLENYEQE